jgi:hypothetical protein
MHPDLLCEIEWWNVMVLIIFISKLLPKMRSNHWKNNYSWLVPTMLHNRLKYPQCRYTTENCSHCVTQHTKVPTMHTQLIVPTLLHNGLKSPPCIHNWFAVPTVIHNRHKAPPCIHNWLSPLCYTTYWSPHYAYTSGVKKKVLMSSPCHTTSWPHCAYTTNSENVPTNTVKNWHLPFEFFWH